ncbi:MAG: AAA family ATPase [Deltaproteobacteria bacterium]|nr:AAA family ATPase [Deltaproteobacteria bacterium]
MFRPDQPIQSKKEDVLGRNSFAQSLGEAILNYKEQDSLVIGLFGAWGSGKTSIVNMVLEHIDPDYREKKDKTDTGKPIIIEFNPWNYSDQNQLITQFFQTLSTTIGRSDYGNEAKKAGEKLEKLAKLFGPLKLIPEIGQVVGMLQDVLKVTSEAAKGYGDFKASDLNSIKVELNELLDELSRKIIIVIDDIDRLTNPEIRQIFQLIKSLGDFHNTIYLLAFDKKVVINALKKVQEREEEGSGLEYLEKVVQVPFEIPLISKQEIDRLVFSQINELTKDIPEERWDQVDWGNMYYSGLTHFFNTIRDVTRYINSLKFGFNLVKDDVNTADFFAITALQVFVPEVYYGIRENKQLFAGIFDSRDDGTGEQAQKRCDEIIERTNKLPQEALKKLLTRLFPKLETIYGNTDYSYEFLAIWRKNYHICSPDVFDIFFRLSLPEGYISQKEMQTILSLANNPAAFSEALLNLNEDGRILRFLERLRDYIGDIPDEHIESIMTVLMDIGDVFPEADEGSPNTYWFYELSHRVDSQEKRFNIFKHAIEKATQSVWSLTYEVSLEGARHGKYDSQAKPWPKEKLTVRPEQLAELETLACKKIEQWAHDGQLGEHPKLFPLLLRWKTWGNPEHTERFVHDLIATNEGLLDFIASFLSPVKTYGLSDYVHRQSWRIPLEHIEEFVDIKNIETRIRTICSSSEFNQLDDKKKLAVKTFLDTVDGKIKEHF